MRLLSERVLRGFALFVIVAHPLAYITMFAGDAEVHLAYAEQAARGHWFVYNPGEVSAGVTSPGSLIVLAGLFRLFPAFYVPLVIKLLSLLAWLGLAWGVSKLLVALEIRPLARWTSLLLFAMMPGVVYHTALGMENVFFALLVVAVFLLALRERWWSEPCQLWREWRLALLLGVGCWLRPEGLMVAGLLYGWRLWCQLRGSPERGHVLVRLAVGSLPCWLCAGGVWLFHWWCTGLWFPASGKARLLFGSIDALRLGPFILSIKWLRLQLFYFPLTGLLLWGIWRFVRRDLSHDLRQREGWDGSLLLLGSFFFFFTFLFPAAHFSRYVLFLMPLWFCWVAVGLQDMVERVRRPLWALGAIACVVAALAGGEVVLRWRSGGQFYAGELFRVMKAPSMRAQRSAMLLKRLGITAPHCLARPVRIAMQEVQLRYYLDQRFVVRSLDGRVDRRLLDFFQPQGIDHIGYLKARKVDFLTELPGLQAHTTSRWKLRTLRRLKPGQSVVYEGLRFRMVRSGIAVLDRRGHRLRRLYKVGCVKRERRAEKKRMTGRLKP